MTVLSIEAVLSKMNMEQLWDIRKNNQVLKWISDGIPLAETRKWKVKYITIEVDRIVANGLENVQYTTLNYTKQTRWATPIILSLRDSCSEVIQKSIFPVSSTFCSHIESLDIYSTQSVSKEYLNTVQRLMERCPKVWNLCVHVPNVTEDQLLQFLESLELEKNEKDELKISLSSSVQLTPHFIREFTTLQGIKGKRMIIVKQPENEEIETPKRAAILQFFMNNSNYRNANGTTIRVMAFERMDHAIAHAIVFELEQIYEEGETFYQNGSLAFYLGRPGCCVQLEILELDHTQLFGWL